MTPAQEIHEQRAHILDGRCKWVGRGPTPLVNSACLFDRYFEGVRTQLSENALPFVVRAISVLHPRFPIIDTDTTDDGWWYTCASFNDGFGFNTDHSWRGATEQEVLEVLERAEKLALMDEEA